LLLCADERFERLVLRALSGGEGPHVGHLLVEIAHAGVDVASARDLQVARADELAALVLDLAVLHLERREGQGAASDGGEGEGTEQGGRSKVYSAKSWSAVNVNETVKMSEPRHDTVNQLINYAGNP